MFLTDYDFIYEETLKLLNNEDCSDKPRLGRFLVDEMARDKNAVVSICEILMMHLLKCLYQKERTSRSWHNTILNTHRTLEEYTTESKNLYNHLVTNFDKCYKIARRKASNETRLDINTFPINNIFEINNLINLDWILNFLDEHPIQIW